SVFPTCCRAGPGAVRAAGARARAFARRASRLLLRPAAILRAAAVPVPCAGPVASSAESGSRCAHAASVAVLAVPAELSQTVRALPRRRRLRLWGVRRRPGAVGRLWARPRGAASL
ncbi:unnamed protein product, partial [Prorocentrum cordatum]